MLKILKFLKFLLSGKEKKGILDPEDTAKDLLKEGALWVAGAALLLIANVFLVILVVVVVYNFLKDFDVV